MTATSKNKLEWEGSASMRSLVSFAREHGPSLLLLALLTVASYSNSFEIPFLYSEKDGIRENIMLRDLGEFSRRMFSVKGLLQKPLSMLTFALNYAFGGLNVSGYHLVNLSIHLFNSCLVYLLAARYFCAPLVSALFFALHPLATSVASQIFGRTYALGSFFMLLFLLVYFREASRGGIGKKGLAVLSVLLLLAVLSKQVFVVLPLLIIWHGFATSKISFGTGKAFFLLSSVVLGLLFLFLYAIPLSETANISAREFFLSQFGNLSSMLSFFLLPFQTSLIHPLPVYTKIANTDVIVGILFVTAFLLSVFFKRKTQVAFLLGCLFICIFPTNSFLPKNEIIREWRLYPSTVFLSLTIGYLYHYLVAKAGPVVAKVLFATYFVLFAASVYTQNFVYKNGLRTWTQIAVRYPRSADAEHNLGLAYLELGQRERAIEKIKRAVAIDPSVSLFYKNLSAIYAEDGKKELATEMLFKSVVSAQVYGVRNMSITYVK